jgi:hypothetical protein
MGGLNGILFVLLLQLNKVHSIKPNGLYRIYHIKIVCRGIFAPKQTIRTHIVGGVHVYSKADTSNGQQHMGSQQIKVKSPVGIKATNVEPWTPQVNTDGATHDTNLNPDKEARYKGYGQARDSNNYTSAMTKSTSNHRAVKQARNKASSQWDQIHIL